MLYGRGGGSFHLIPDAPALSPVASLTAIPKGLMGALAMAGTPYDRWLRFILPFMVKIWIVGSIALAVAVFIGYS